MNNSFLSEEELKQLGIKEIGKNVLISRKASFYNAQNIIIRNNVRIDDFCILSGNITIGNNVHISAGCYLFAGEAGIELNDYSGLSSRCAVYAITDDYSGEYMTNPTLDSIYRGVISKKVTIGKYSIIGTGSTILPGVDIAEGCALGAMSLANKSTDSWGIYVGIPCRKMKERSRKLLKLL